MSWLVKNLVVNSTRIRDEANLESPDYISLLTLESKIIELYKKDIIKQDELDLLVDISNLIDLDKVSEKLDIHKVTVIRRFERLANKLAYYLGSYYTNFGYVSYMVDKYNLDTDETNKLMEFIFNERNYDC